jgi:hypothetical protein
MHHVINYKVLQRLSEKFLIRLRDHSGLRVQSKEISFFLPILLSFR